MGDDGSGVRRVAGFDPAEEVEEGGRILRHAVIRPGCELELTNFPPLAAAALQETTQPDGLCAVWRISFLGVAYYNLKTIFIKCLNGTDMLPNLFAYGLPATSALIMTQHPH